MLLLGFDGVIGIWTLVLAVLATRIAHRISSVKSLIVVLVTLAMFVGGIFFAALELGYTAHM